MQNLTNIHLTETISPTSSVVIMVAADVYDALISRRVYKEPLTHEQTVEKIGEGRGTHFDPVMIDAFMRIEKKFKEIAIKFKET